MISSDSCKVFLVDVDGIVLHYAALSGADQRNG